MNNPLNRPAFFAALRGSLFRGRFSQSQVDGLNVLLDVWEADYGDHPGDWLAYCLATAYHETAHTLQPIEEYGKGRGHRYGLTDHSTGQAYYGRGYVQLTWLSNYERAGRELGRGRDFVTRPALVMEPATAARILYAGMIGGWFTGRKLGDFFAGGRANPREARRVVNGMDRADLIAGYFSAFYAALKGASGATPPQPSPYQGRGEGAATGRRPSRSTTVGAAATQAVVTTAAVAASVAGESPVWLYVAAAVAVLAAAWIIRERWLKYRNEGV